MTLVVGVVLFAASLAALMSSMPRGGKTAKFVGSQWEGYIVVVMICLLGLGLMLTITGTVELIRG